MHSAVAVVEAVRSPAARGDRHRHLAGPARRLRRCGRARRGAGTGSGGNLPAELRQHLSVGAHEVHAGDGHTLPGRSRRRVQRRDVWPRARWRRCRGRPAPPRGAVRAVGRTSRCRRLPPHADGDGDGGEHDDDGRQSRQSDDPELLATPSGSDPFERRSGIRRKHVPRLTTLVLLLGRPPCSGR